MGVYTFCYFSNAGNANYRKLVVNYGNAYRIPSQNGYDRITFFFDQAPLFSSSDQITTNWAGQIDSTGFIDGTTPQSLTPFQGIAANLQSIVRAEPPVTSGSLSPNLLANNLANTNPSTGKVTYSVKNQGGSSNHVKYLEILIPYETYSSQAGDPSHPFNRENFGTPVAGDFTNTRLDGSAVAPTVTVVGNENISGKDYRVVRFTFADGAKLGSGQTFTVDMDLKYFRNTNLASQSFEIKHRADNVNYAAAPAYPYPQYTNGSEDATASWVLSLTPPEPRGEAFMFRGNDQNTKPQIFTNEVVSSNISDIKMKLYNKGGVGNDIHSIELHYPSYLNITDVCSGYLNILGGAADCASDGNANIDINGVTHVITIDYQGLSYPLKSSQDTIAGTVCTGEVNTPCEILTFTIAQDVGLADPTLADDVVSITDGNSDGIYETVTASSDSEANIRTGTFYAKLNNASGVDSYTRAATGKSLNLTLEYPNPVIEAFVTTDLVASYEVDATAPTTTFKTYIKNTAKGIGNNIYKVDIKFPNAPAIVSGSPSVVSLKRDDTATITPLTAVTDYTTSWNAGSQTLTLTYTTGNELLASLEPNDGTSYVDAIEIQFTDTVTTTSTQNFLISGYNIVGGSATGKFAAASVMDGSDGDDAYNNASNQDLALLYKIPPALATGTIEPKIAYTTASTFTMQSKIYVQNKAAVGTSNKVFKVRIGLPAGVSVADASAVQARTGTVVGCAGGNGFTGGCSGAGEAITIDYTTAAPAYLDANNDPDDEILLTWSHSKSIEGDLVFSLGIDNNDGNGYNGNQEAIPASLLSVALYNEPTVKVEVVSKPGDPTSPASMINNQTVRSTVPSSDFHRFRVTITPNTNGPKIHQLAITPPAMFDPATLDTSDLLPAGTTMAVDGSTLVVSFAGGKLEAASTSLEFRLKPTRTFNMPGADANEVDAAWGVAADFFSDIYTNATYNNGNLPGPSFVGLLVADGNDDTLAYVPGSSFGTPRPMIAIAGSGAVGLNWDTTRFANPDPSFVMYVRPNEVFRINPGDPNYKWTHEIRLTNQGEKDNDIRIAEITPPTGFLTSLGTACNTSTACDITTTGIQIKKGVTGANESSWATLTLTTEYTLSSVQSVSTTYTLATPETIRIVLAESARVLNNESLLITFDASHGQTSTSSHTWLLKAGNYNATQPLINGSDPVPLGETKNSTVVTPTYTANFILKSVNDVGGADSVLAASSRNKLGFTLTNNSNGGDKLTKLKIAMPGYFTVGGAVVTSAKGATVSTNADTADYDTVGIENVISAVETNSFNKQNYIQLQYPSGLLPSESDDITITIDDTFFKSTSPLGAPGSRADSDGYIERSGTPTEKSGDGIGNDNGVCEPNEICEGGSVTFKASAEYDTSSGASSYIAAFPTGADRLTINQPAVSANAWLSYSSIPLDGAGPRTHSVSLQLKNTALADTSALDNTIYRAKIKLPREVLSGSFISKIENLEYKVGGGSFATVTGDCNDTTCSGSAVGDANDYFVLIDFTNGGSADGLKPQESAEIRFDIQESVSGTGYVDVEVFAENGSSVGSNGKPDIAQYLAVDTSVDKGTLLTTETPSETLRLSFVPEDPPSEGQITYSVDPMIVSSTRTGSEFVFNKSDLETLAKYCKPADPNLTDNCDARFTVYALGEYADVYYQIKNGSQNFAIESAKVKLSIFDANNTTQDKWSGLEVVSLTSARLGEITSPVIVDLDLYDGGGAAEADDTLGTDSYNETKEITIDYSSLSGGGIAIGQSDTVKIRLKLKPALVTTYLTATDASLTYDEKGKASGFDVAKNVEFKLSSQVKRVSVIGYRSTTGAIGQQYFYTRRAPFARITGLLAPKDAPVTFSLQETTGTNATLDGGGTMPIIVARYLSSDTYGTFVFDRVSVGSQYAILAKSADPKYETQEYIKRREEKGLEKSLFSVTANGVTELKHNDEQLLVYEVRYKQLNAAVNNELASPLDGRTKIILPAGALDNNPRINIRIEETATQAWGTLSHSTTQASSYSSFGIAAPAQHHVYNLVNELPSGGVLSSVIENQLKEEATLILGYDLSEFSGVNERNLAIYYWEMTRQRWVKIGGKVDTSTHTLTAQITYMHRTYTVLPSNGAAQGIDNVEVFPRVFTPGRSDSFYTGAVGELGGEKTFGNLKLTFELGASSIGKKYEVGIYNMSGRLMKHWEKENSTGQGSIYWDGRDTYGGLVTGGIYVYVIRVGSDKFRGTLIVAR